MINKMKIVVVLPAYNAAKTIENTYNEIPFDIVDEVVLWTIKAQITASRLPISLASNISLFIPKTKDMAQTKNPATRRLLN